MLRRLTLAFLANLLPLGLSAQDLTLWGGLPSIQIDGNLTDRLEYFLQTGAETYWYKSSEGKTAPDFFFRHIDLAGGLSRDVGTDWNLAGSLVLRRRQPFANLPGWELRPWLQLTHVIRAGKYRFRNRFRAEYRFVQPRKNEDWRFDLRLRHRLSLDFPLQGERLDLNEFYLNSSAELLLTPTTPDFWFYRNPRGYLGIGRQLKNNIKLETGLEFRAQNDNAMGDDEHILFWRINWVKTFDYHGEQ